MRNLICRLMLAVLGILAMSDSGFIQAQNVALDDPPTLYIPKKPPTQKEIDRREALYQFVRGLLHEQEGSLFLALQAFQDATRLDPEAAPVFKAQVPLMLALNRQMEALEIITKVIELDPGDSESCFIQARLYKAFGKNAEARVSLQKGLASDRIKERPELAHQLFFDLGSIFESEKSHQKAAEAFDKAVSILEHPEHSLELGLPPEAIRARIAEVCERIGVMYRKEQQYDKAVIYYKKAQEKSPATTERLSFELANILRQQGKLRPALDNLEKYLSLRPQGVEAYRLKIELLQGLQRDKEVLAWLEEVCRTDKFNDALRLLLAKQYVQFRQFANAESIYLGMHEKSPSVEVYQDLFQVYREKGKPGIEELLQLLNRTFGKAAEGPNSAAAQARFMLKVVRDDGDLSNELTRQALERLDMRVDLKWQLVQILGLLAQRHRKMDDAERFFRNCLRNVQPDSGYALEIYRGLVRVLFKARKYDVVEKLCRERLQKAEGQDSVFYYNDLATALSATERFDAALKAIDEAIKIASDSKLKQGVQFSRIRILCQKLDFKQAEAECLAMLKTTLLPSEMIEIHYRLSGIYSAAKQPEKSEEELRTVLSFDSNNATANNDLGYMWADQNRNLKEAEEMIRKAIDIDREERKNLPREEDQDNAAYVDSLGWVLFRRGHFQEAYKELKRATVLPGGEDPVIWDHLGDVCYQLKLHDEAHRSWQIGLDLFERDHLRPKDERYRDLQRKAKMERPIP